MFNITSKAKVIWRRGPAKSHIRQTGGTRAQTWDPWVQGEWFIHQTMAAPDLLACCYWESVSAQNDHYPTAFVPRKVLHRKFIATFLSLQAETFFSREIQCQKKYVLIFSA